MEVTDSDIARAIITRHRYGCEINRDHASRWLESEPQRAYHRVGDLMRVCTRALGGISESLELSVGRMMWDEPRILATQSTNRNGDMCVTIALMPQADTHADATDEILGIWNICGAEGAELSWTPSHIYARVNDDQTVIMVRSYITHADAVHRWPHVYRVDTSGDITVTTHESALMRWLLDSWYLDGQFDHCTVIAGTKFALTRMKDMQPAIDSVIREVKKIVRARGLVVKIDEHENTCIQIHVRPVPTHALMQLITAHYPTLTNVRIRYDWTCPIDAEIAEICERACMRKTFGTNAWILTMPYEHKKSTERVPFDPRVPVPTLHGLEFESPMRKWGYAAMETCLRLIHKRAPVSMLPKVVWNGIVRLALYRHAGMILLQVFDSLPCDVTFQHITTVRSF
jgi:hypothetical protein